MNYYKNSKGVVFKINFLYPSSCKIVNQKVKVSTYFNEMCTTYPDIIQLDSVQLKYPRKYVRKTE